MPHGRLLPPCCAVVKPAAAAARSAPNRSGRTLAPTRRPHASAHYIEARTGSQCKAAPDTAPNTAPHTLAFAQAVPALRPGSRADRAMALQQLPRDVLRHVFLHMLSPRVDGGAEDMESAWALAQCSRHLLSHYAAFFLRSVAFEDGHALAHSLALCRVAGRRGLVAVSTSPSQGARAQGGEVSAAAACPLETIAVHCRKIRRLDYDLWTPNCATAFRRVLHICTDIECLVLRDPPRSILRVLASGLAASCLPSLSHLRLTFSTGPHAPLDLIGGRDLLSPAAQTVDETLATATGEQIEAGLKLRYVQSLATELPRLLRNEGLSNKDRPQSLPPSHPRHFGRAPSHGSRSRQLKSTRRSFALGNGQAFPVTKFIEVLSS